MRCRILSATLLLAGCGGPLSTLAPSGPVAAEIAWLWWAMLAGAGVITLFVLGLLALAFGRPRETSTRRWTHGLGLWFSLGVLTLLLGAGLVVGERILPRDDGAVTVRAHAFQWGWSFTHEGADGAPVESAGLMHIPAGQPVDILITSEDVIHSFWVPRLAGKMDAIPGRTNRLRLIADSPGVYAGLCAEFCGRGHAGMRFDVQAHADWPPENWPPEPERGRQ
ncbi:cytochrome c oxidase subunit II [Natronohydrobacter thiooxidans]|jgi:cytochrome c oxidase subunit 2|uniref:cytochrome c oxidase subunit II n=1 Tax=Natronohydrobacter thiooxidans TaxID=87172 RepID=UPI0008FF0EF5|nr:cytochrome c oxidase subunit II [Natronohydrobacter thiooxidans]